MSFIVTPTNLAQAQSLLAADGKPVLVDFYATWCGPCKAMAPALEAFATERQETLSVVKLDVDEFPEIAAKVGLRSVPTLLVVKDGQTLAAKSGALSKQALADFVDRALS